MIKADLDANLVSFTTWRPFLLDNPLYTEIKLESVIPLSIASGATARTEWSERTEHGKIDLLYSLS